MNQLESAVQTCIESWRRMNETLPSNYSFFLVASFCIPEGANPDDYLLHLKPFFDDVEKTSGYRALYFMPNQTKALDRETEPVGSLRYSHMWEQSDLDMELAKKRFGDESLEEDYLKGRGAPETVARIGHGPWRSFAVGVLRPK